VLLKYGRDEELEADRLGVRYMSSVGYNPRGQLEVMQVLAKLSQGSSQPAILSTHPDPAARIEQIQKLLSTEYASTQGNPAYQEFKDRYQVEFLEVIRTVPRPPKQKAAVEGVPAGALVDLRDATTWCGVCAAAARQESHAQAPEPGPVPPRKGVYAYIAPAP
jgi:predicted Zn-dependent protease